MIKCEIMIPDNIASSLKVTKSDGSAVIKKELAGYFFEHNFLSFGQAREFAELPVWDFVEFLKKRNIPLNYDIPELQDDLETIKDI